ncbi:sigma factor G inhibitor Gin [Alkalihalobacillus sp. AL-G]|uniref:sigma factor G inhibitor Gin n=1 Tax=Alkalihalobacillus sp. AL-G TaxID=2926399 RepID=UPI00272C6A6C|nr:sigma factor G inhibitor Gin [Alkalihalobacillus sp. AL-G]WLD93439.1 sigma factor G inhibitor Gin [Alkalihalobacillus sp. AL-G]
MKATKQTLETCMVCEKKAEKGIHIFHHFLCCNCEQKMISTDTDDEEYQYFIEKLRKINRVSC